MKCSKCNEDSDSCCGWPIGWVWVQTEKFEPEGVRTAELIKDKPYYLLCAECKEEVFLGLQGYKTVVERKVVPV